jgi:hypothetical protein
LRRTRESIKPKIGPRSGRHAEDNLSTLLPNGPSEEK